MVERHTFTQRDHPLLTNVVGVLVGVARLPLFERLRLFVRDFRVPHDLRKNGQAGCRNARTGVPASSISLSLLLMCGRSSTDRDRSLHIALGFHEQLLDVAQRRYLPVAIERSYTWLKACSVSCMLSML